MRARRSRTGSTAGPALTGPSLPGGRSRSPARRSRPRCSRAQAALWSWRAGSGSRRNASSSSGRVGSNQRKPERAELVGHRVRPDRDRPPVDGGLDRRVAEPLPGGRERHRVGGRVGVGHRAGRRPVDHAHRAPRRRSAVERRLVAVLGRDRRASRWRRGRRPARAAAGTPLRSMARTGCTSSRSSSATAERRAGRRRGRRAARRRRSRCRSWSPRCPASAISRSVRRLIVTCRQAGSVGGSSVTCAHCGALPRRIVVVEHGGPAAQPAGHHAGRR